MYVQQVLRTALVREGGFIAAAGSAAADHIDHVKTQFPYALTCAAAACAAYLLIGFFVI